MKKIISLALAAALSAFTINSTYAQDAKKILQSISTTYGGQKGLTSSFVLKFLDNKGNEKTTQKGTLALKGNKYKVTVAGATIITDGKSTWTYNAKDKEVQVDNYNPNATISPAKLFAGSYDKEYNYKSAGETTVNGVKAYIIELTPKVAKKEFTKVQLFVNKTNNDLLGGKVFEKAGSSIHYTLSNTKPNANLSDAEFTFNAKAYPGVDVIDLR